MPQARPPPPGSNHRGKEVGTYSPAKVDRADLEAERRAHSVHVLAEHALDNGRLAGIVQSAMVVG
jgi:hypothetical protein